MSYEPHETDDDPIWMAIASLMVLTVVAAIVWGLVWAAQ